MLIAVREHIIMRTLAPKDAAEIYQVIDRDRTYLRTWLPWVDETDSANVTKDVITSWEEDFKNKRDIVLGIFENGRYIGNIGLHGLHNYNRSGMIGYWLAQNRQGCGVISDCVRALTNYGFYELGLNRIYIHCAAGNKKSRAVPERLGFLKEGVLQDGEYLYEVFHDLVVYGMVKRHWQTCDTLSLVFPAPEQNTESGLPDSRA